MTVGIPVEAVRNITDGRARLRWAVPSVILSPLLDLVRARSASEVSS